MDPIALREDELKYEVSIRGIDISDENPDLVQLLRDNLEVENYIAEGRLASVQTETQTLGVKFTELKMLISRVNCDNVEDFPGSKRLLNLICHLCGRATRYFFNAPPRYTVEAAHCISELQTLVAELKVKCPAYNAPDTLIDVEPFLNAQYRSGSSRTTHPESTSAGDVPRTSTPVEEGNRSNEDPSAAASGGGVASLQPDALRMNGLGAAVACCDPPGASSSGNRPSEGVGALLDVPGERDLPSGTQYRDLPRAFSRLEVSQRDRQNPVLKWSIRFSGKKKENVNSFVRRVDELLEATGATDAEVVSGAFHLFEDAALTWYRAHKNRIRTWLGLKRLLRDDFLPYKYDDDMLMHIHSRKQGPQEDIAIYISHMLGLFDNLSDLPSDSEQLRIIVRNLAPFYLNQIDMSSITSLNQLKNKGKELEYKRTLQQEYERSCARRGPSDSAQSQGRYPARETQLSAINEDHRDESVRSQQRPQQSFRRQRAPLKCWNCDQEGHRHPDCHLPRNRVFCFKCGHPEVRTYNCPCCSSGNGSRDQ